MPTDNTKHTPGPWHVGRPVSGRRFTREDIEVQTDRGSMVCVMYAENASTGGKRDRANAQLIATAPEMLEALKIARKCIAWCREHHKDIQSGEGLPVETVLDSVIAKAETSQ